MVAQELDEFNSSLSIVKAHFPGDPLTFAKTIMDRETAEMDAFKRKKFKSTKTCLEDKNTDIEQKDSSYNFPLYLLMCRCTALETAETGAFIPETL